MNTGTLPLRLSRTQARPQPGWEEGLLPSLEGPVGQASVAYHLAGLGWSLCLIPDKD